MNLRISTPNLKAAISVGADVRVYALAKQVGDFGEQMDTLVGIGGTLCENGDAVCVTILPEHLYEENPFLTQFMITAYSPTVGGNVQFWNVQNVQPNPGALNIQGGDTLSVRATVSMQSPFAPGAPLVGPIGPLSHYGPRCVDPANNNKPISLPVPSSSGPPCPGGLIVRQHWEWIFRCQAEHRSSLPRTVKRTSLVWESRALRDLRAFGCGSTIPHRIRIISPWRQDTSIFCVLLTFHH